MAKRYNHNVKAIIIEIKRRAVEAGDKRQPINDPSGPSPKYMTAFYNREP